MGDNRWIRFKNPLNTQLRHHHIDELSDHFPLCMKYSHLSLLKDGHLKNNARLQFGLFLKDIGLSVDEAITYFRQKMTKKSKQFPTKYMYSIKHINGREGGFKNY